MKKLLLMILIHTLYAENYSLEFSLGDCPNCDFVEIENDATLNFSNEDFSISFWFKTISDHGIFMGKGGGGIGWNIQRHPNEIRFDIRTDTGDNQGFLSSINLVPFGGLDNNWHYLTITIDRSNGLSGKMYLDGILLTTNQNDNSGSIDNNLPLLFGKREDGWPGNYQGLLDNVSFWAKKLSIEEIQNAMTHIEGTEDELVGLWKLNGGVGDMVYDNSSFENHGVIMNDYSSLTWSIDVPLISGCTDPLATNYNLDANVNDGSCKYEVLQTIIYNNQGYMLINNQTDYFSAQSNAENMGGYLVSISSSEENNYLFNLGSQILNQYNDDNLIWIGLSLVNNEWVWDSGEDLVFTNWAPNEPSGNSNEGCGEFYIQNSNPSTWNDIPCSEELFYIIEFDDYNQVLPESTEMTFYYFNSFTLDGEAVTAGTEIVAKNEASGRIVGYGVSENVGNGNTEIVVFGEMGDDLDAVFGTEGYMIEGETPQFYVNGIKAHYSAANGDELQSIPSFVSLEQYTDLTLNLVTDCNGDMGGAASVDYCGDCWGGESGNDTLVNDPDADEICGESDNCPETANFDQLNYDGDSEGDACDSDDDNDGEADENDNDPLNEFACHDEDGDGCDECYDGTLGDTNNDGEDYDSDGWCNSGDSWPDCFNAEIDADPNDECGNCNGDGFADNCIGTDDCEDMDCLGNCGQSAYIDDCGECDDNPNTDCYDLSLDLHAGPNLISFPALPDDTSVPSIFDDTGCIVPGVIGEGIGAVYLMGNWVGSLQYIEQDRGYWVKVYDGCNFTLEDCEPVSYDNDGEVVYEMQFGPNLISYPFQTSQTIEAAVGHVEENIYGFIAEGEAAVNMDGEWYGSMEEFKSGGGYWLLALNDFTFSFNGIEADIPREDQTNSIALLPEKFKVEQSTQQAFFFVEELYLQTMEIDSEDIFLAYNGEILIGARYWNGRYTDIPAMGDDNSETTLDFAKQGGQIRFKLFDSSTGNLVELESDEPAYWQDFGMTIVSLTEKLNLPESFGLAKAYPNPFNPVTTLTYALPVDSHVSLVVYDLTGREITTLVNGFTSTGYHSITWNADIQSSGVYFVHFSAGDYHEVQKIMLMK